MKLTLYLLLVILCFLCACGLVTEAARSVGIPIGPGTDEAAKAADAATIAWIDKLLFGLLGVASSEGTRAAHRIRQKRKARKANTPSTIHTGGAS